VTLYDKLAFSRHLSFLFTPVIQHLVSQLLLHQYFYFSTTDLVPVHPMETYHASKDYALFEAEEIRPFMHAAHNQATLFKK